MLDDMTDDLLRIVERKLLKLHDEWEPELKESLGAD